MKDDFEVGDSVYEIGNEVFVGRIVAIAEYECYVAWSGDYASWVVSSSLEKVED